MAGEAAAISGALAARDDEAANGALLPLRDAEQLELLRDGRGRLDGIAAKAAPRGRGRPPGAKNKKTEAIGRYITEQFGDPLVALASIYARATDTIVAELGCKPIEALAIQAKAAAEVAPYVHGKQPVAIDMTLKADMVLAIAGLTDTQEAVEELQAGEWVEVSDDDLDDDIEDAETAEISHSSDGGA